MIKKLISIIICCFLSLSIAACETKNKEMTTDKINTVKDNKNYENEIYESNSENQYSKNEIYEDLNVLFERLEGFHPMLKNEAKKKEFKEKLDEMFNNFNENESKEEIYFQIQKLLTYFNDGHTACYYLDNLEMYPISIVWTSDGVIVDKKNEYFNKGDKILQINGKDIRNIFDEFSELVPSENKNWSRHLFKQYIPTKLYMNKLDLIKEEKVSVLVERINGDTEIVDIITTKWDKIFAGRKVKDYSFEIIEKDRAAILTLNKCLYNDDIVEKLGEFFKDIKTKNIEKLIIDVRKSTSGNSKVISEIMSYIDVEYYKSFYNADYGIQENKVRNYKSEDAFGGTIYVFTSNSTFSSANWLAGIMQANKLGIIVGESTGNAPDSYGYASTSTLPNTKLKISTSIIPWGSPYEDKEKEYITPDIYIPLRRENIILGKDPLIESIIK